MLTINAVHIKLLEKLCNAVAVSGDEGEVRKKIWEMADEVASEVERARMASPATSPVSPRDLPEVGSVRPQSKRKIK